MYYRKASSSEGVFAVTNYNQQGNGPREVREDGGAALEDGEGAGQGGPLGWMDHIPASPFFLLNKWEKVPHLYVGNTTAGFTDNNADLILLLCFFLIMTTISCSTLFLHLQSLNQMEHC